MVLLLSHMFTEGCQHHGHLLSFRDDFSGRERREFPIIKMMQLADLFISRIDIR
jgi:hypothetical protein